VFCFREGGREYKGRDEGCWGSGVLRLSLGQGCGSVLFCKLVVVCFYRLQADCAVNRSTSSQPTRPTTEHKR